MKKYLGWAWKPDKDTVESEKTVKAKKYIRKKERRRGRRLSKTEKLCLAPGHIFYRSKRWLNLKRRVLLRYGYKCMCCGAVGVELHVDHIKPRSKNPHLSLVFDNLQVLCRECNLEKSNIHDTDYRDKAELV